MAAIDPQKRIVILALFGATFGIFLIDFSTGSGGGRYTLQAATLVPLGVVVGIKQLYELDGKTSKNLKKIAILLTVLIFLFYSSGVLQYSVYGGDISDNGEDLVKAVNGIDTFIETTPEETVVLSTLHVSEGILKYYNTGSYEVHGIPQDTFNQHRMTNSTHTSQVYDENNEEHQRRLEHLVADKEYVVVFTAYAYTDRRYGSVSHALVSRNFIPIKKSGNRWAGYVVFKKKS